MLGLLLLRGIMTTNDSLHDEFKYFTRFDYQKKRFHKLSIQDPPTDINSYNHETLSTIAVDRTFISDSISSFFSEQEDVERKRSRLAFDSAKLLLGVEMDNLPIKDDSRIDQELRNITNENLVLHQITYGAAAQEVVPLKAELVDLPDKAGTVDLVDYLPPHLKSLLENEEAFALKEVRTKRPNLRKMNAAEQEEYEKLILRMVDCGMVQLSSEAPKETCSVFCVSKADSNLQRLIINAQRTNCWFEEPPKTRLPNLEMLAQARAKKVRLFAAKYDLSNFYHFLKLPAWLRKFFCLPKISSETARKLGFSDSEIQPMLVTLPMGWSFSVFLAQAAHEFILKKAGVLESEFLHFGARDFSKKVFLVYIDDFVLFAYDEQTVVKWFKICREAVEKAGFVIKPSKMIELTCDSIDVIGVRFDLKKKMLVPKPSSFDKLLQRTVALVQASSMTGDFLASIVGSWVWFLLLRREMLSILVNVYKFIFCAQSKYYELWSSVKSELLTLLILAPLIRKDLCVLDAPIVVATDASMGGGAVSASYYPSKDQRSRLLNLPKPGEGRGDFLQGMKFASLFHWHWQEITHINKLEMMATFYGLRWFCSQQKHTHKALSLLTDSSTVYFSLKKGRTSARGLVSVIRRIMAAMLVSNVVLDVRWIPTEINPADYGSRL